MARPVAVVLLGVVAATSGCAPRAEEISRERLSVADVLGPDGSTGFARALEPRPLAFPADHGPHPDFASEWWYFTGNLDGADGGQLGYQLTFFRTALAPPSSLSPRSSPWATGQAWMAHFAVSDISGGNFHAFDRFERGALGLAGGQANPWRVWLDDWSLEQVGETVFPLRLRAATGDDVAESGARVGLDLRLEPLKPVVLQGDEGLSRKGMTPGNASYYYSFTRLRTAGTMRLGDREIAVEGTSWLDREWSTSVLEEGQRGWDWFALQLDDGVDLMYYQIREADGAPSPTSAGTLVFADGAHLPLGYDDVELRVSDHWTSPIDGARYPAGWRLTVPGRAIDLRIAPLLADQELDVAFRYWEGAVQVSGSGAGGTPVRGRGYVELTGYAGGGSPP
ncbi:MAG: lipocalin-like domain-containing protein [Acidobacteriota bacterium]